MPRKNNPSFEEAKASVASFIRSYRPCPRVCRCEIRIGPIDQIAWLSCQPQRVKVFGANQEDTAAIAGVGEALRLAGRGSISYSKIFGQLRQYLSPLHPHLQWYGGFCFDPRRKDGDWRGFGSWRFVLPRFELAREKDRMIFACNLVGRIDQKKLLQELSVLSYPSKSYISRLKFLKRKDIPDWGNWHKSVERVLMEIDRGICDKVVLARKTEFILQDKANPWALLAALKKVTPHSYHFAFEFNGQVFLGASPERLYKRQGRVFLTEALAGTKPAAVAARALLNSAKDRHEHDLVVQAIADALKGLCHKVKFPSKPGIRALSNGHHLLTPFEGHLKDGVEDEDVLQSLHPTPALGGVPRNVALKTIRRMEPFGRGWYAGPLGYVGLDWAEFVVGIRSGLIKDKKLSVFAGAGIVAGSNAEDEWQEIENKISNFIKIIK